MRDSTEIGIPAGTGGVNHIMTVYTANNNGHLFLLAIFSMG